MRTLYDILLQLIRDADAAVDRIHRLLDGLEIFLEDAVQTPAQVGTEAPTVVQAPVNSEIHAHMPVAHIIAEIIITTLAFVMTQLYLLSSRITLRMTFLLAAQVTIVCPAFKLL